MQGSSVGDYNVMYIMPLTGIWLLASYSCGIDWYVVKIATLQGRSPLASTLIFMAS